MRLISSGLHSPTSPPSRSAIFTLPALTRPHSPTLVHPPSPSLTHPTLTMGTPPIFTPPAAQVHGGSSIEPSMGERPHSPTQRVPAVTQHDRCPQTRTQVAHGPSRGPSTSESRRGQAGRDQGRDHPQSTEKPRQPTGSDRTTDSQEKQHLDPVRPTVLWYWVLWYLRVQGTGIRVSFSLSCTDLGSKHTFVRSFFRTSCHHPTSIIHIKSHRFPSSTAHVVLGFRLSSCCCCIVFFYI